MATDFEVPTTAELGAMFEALKNWDRWGAGDQRGTLNHLTADRRTAAARSVRSGESISLSHDLATEPLPEHPHPVQHHMLAAGDARDSNGIPGYEAARDHLSLDVHGLWTTHVDALSHMFVSGVMYGGRPAAEVRSDGAVANSVATMADGVVGRGVLLDVPRALGIDFLEPGQVVSVADLERAEQAQGVTVGSGDIVIVAWGREAHRRSSKGFGGFSGLHPECLPWLHEREIAVLGSDGISDPMPFIGTPDWPFPVHQIGIVAMGLPLIDNVRVAELGGRLAELDRWDFLFVIAPLRIPKATGCPVNPLAIL
ncbi:MAG TPA: cyclase family protein [Acidimicrobiales bacterium]